MLLLLYLQSSQVQFPTPSQCVYPRSPAMFLGLFAALALMIAQIIIYVSTGCICCQRSPYPSNSTWRVALVCFVFSWFTFVIAFLLLLTGAALNDEHGEESMYFGNYYCYVVKPGVFAGGALLSFASLIFGLIYYLALTSAKNSDIPWGDPSVPSQGGQGVIAMGQPQFPPHSTQQPVFVHEDTYIRRQFT
ncbi:hypothetical protein CJ030_MR7G025998 [Morella rubra]|uniref:Uncharacterized protein n=1 Tax=Morella rubra TaxID=262757 RepID=A0A6A1UYM5_9ROSI|nr:hypothetical protein CJ030_MR7G025998 [Morella rubra]